MNLVLWTQDVLHEAAFHVGLEVQSFALVQSNYGVEVVGQFLELLNHEFFSF